ncbi:hypothetical protein V493_06760 [Pseudogymnoascus sp. VKM F-4281 (FW-2241)]|nr:hypothetical protein V493_06760 [Pseudogymnoascus sp. VKM F-4281 (FW-2241)]
MNQFVVHSSLDIVEEVQWGTGQMYLKCLDRFYNNYVSCFITPGIPPATDALSTYKCRDINPGFDINRCEPNIRTNRRGNPTVLRRGIRELGEDDHEPILSSQYGSEEPGLQKPRGGVRKEILVDY